MISKTAEYALRAVVHLANDNSRGTSQTVGQIAAGTQVPVGYLAKVLQSLSRAGLITSQRGAGGGFRLAKTPRETSIYEIVQAVDPLERIHQCPLGLEAHSTRLCPLHKRLDDAMAFIEEQFRATTIDELLEEPQDDLKRHTKEKSCGFPLLSAGISVGGTVKRRQSGEGANSLTEYESSKG